MMSQTLQKVDHSALKTNQIIIISLNLLAFILNLWPLAAFVALMMGIGSVLKSLVLALYTKIFSSRAAG